MRSIKTKRQWFVIDGGSVVWQGSSPACAWQFAQGRGSGIVCGEWRPQPAEPESVAPGRLRRESPKVSPRSNQSRGASGKAAREKPRKSR